MFVGIVALENNSKRQTCISQSKLGINMLSTDWVKNTTCRVVKVPFYIMFTLYHFLLVFPSDVFVWWLLRLYSYVPSYMCFIFGSVAVPGTYSDVWISVWKVFGPGGAIPSPLPKGESQWCGNSGCQWLWLSAFILSQNRPSTSLPQ